MGFASRFASGFTKRLDSAIETVSPRWGSQRIASRNACDAQRRLSGLQSALYDVRSHDLEKQLRSGAYDGGTYDRTNSEWNPQIGDANADSLDDLQTLRARSSDLSRNNGIGSGITETLVSNVIGVGFKAEPVIDFDALGITKERAEDFGKEMKRVWRHWQPFADVSNHLDFREMQQVILRGILERGDIFLIKRFKTDGRRPLGFCWQLVEADRVGSPMMGEESTAKNGNRISAGVEVDSDGAPVAYHILKRHPGSDTFNIFDTASFDDTTRVPAFDKDGRVNVLHLYFQKRPGQTRGVPFFAPVILHFQNLEKYMEAELIAKRIAACVGLIFNKNSQFGDGTPRPAGLSETDSAGRKEEELQPGLMMNTTDTDITQVADNRPGDQFDPFVERVIRGIGAGTNLPYELASKDYSKPSYANMRAALLDARRFFQMYQAYISREACQPTWDLVMEEAFVRGMWGRRVKSFFGRERDWLWVKWIPDGWQWIDPPREVKAAIQAIDHDLTSEADDAASRGHDHDEILRSNSNTRRKKRELDLTDKAEEAKIDQMLSATGVPVSIAGQHAMYHREAPTSEEDSTIKPESEPDDPPNENQDEDDDNGQA